MTSLAVVESVPGPQVPRPEVVWGIPRGAVGEWVALTDALALLGRPPLCADDPERWWSRREVDIEDAVAVCRLCPVLGVCREYAIRSKEREGTWGGVTAEQRRVLAGRSR